MAPIAAGILSGILVLFWVTANLYVGNACLAPGVLGLDLVLWIHITVYYFWSIIFLWLLVFFSKWILACMKLHRPIMLTGMSIVIVGSLVAAILGSILVLDSDVCANAGVLSNIKLGPLQNKTVDIIKGHSKDVSEITDYNLLWSASITLVVLYYVVFAISLVYVCISGTRNTRHPTNYNLTKSGSDDDLRRTKSRNASSTLKFH